MPRGGDVRLSARAQGAVLIALLALLLAPQPPAVQKLVEGTLRLVGRFSAAHACPIEPRIALTNGHVVDVRPFDSQVPPFPYAWSDGTGASGFLVPTTDGEGHVTGLERARDLATVEPFSPSQVFPHPLTVARQAPAPGDRVWLLGYSWRNRKSAMEDDVIEARVTRVVALHVLYTPSGQPGSSGSCVVNDAGEVVGINEGGYETDASASIKPLTMWLRAMTKDAGAAAGLAVGVWGTLWRGPDQQPVLPPFPQPRPLTDGPPKE